MIKKRYNFSQSIEILSQFLKIDLLYFVSGSFWASISILGGIVTGLSLSYIFTRFLSLDEFGKYSLVLSIIGLASILSLSGMSQSIIQAVAENKTGTIRLIIIRVFKWSLVQSFLLLLLSSYFFLVHHDLELSLIFVVLSIIFPFFISSSQCISILNGMKRFKSASLVNLLTQSLIAVTIILVFILFKKLIFIIILPIVIATVINSFFTIKLLRQFQKGSIDTSLISLGYNQSLSNLAANSVDHLDKVFVSSFLGYSQNANFTIATLIPLQIHTFLKSLLTVGQLRIFETSTPKLRTALITKFFQLLLLVLVLIILYYLTAPFIFKLLYPKYTDIVYLSQIFAIGLLYFPSNLFGLGLLKYRDSKTILHANLLLLLSTSVIIILLLPWLGLMGVIIGKISGKIVQAVFLWIFFNMTYKREISKSNI